MKPRATFHWPWLLFWCTIGALMWLAAIAGLRALGLALWQAVAAVGALAVVEAVWGVRATREER